MADALLESAAAAEAETGKHKDEHEEPELGGGELVLSVLSPLAVEQVGKLRWGWARHLGAGAGSACARRGNWEEKRVLGGDGKAWLDVDHQGRGWSLTSSWALQALIVEHSLQPLGQARVGCAQLHARRSVLTGAGEEAGGGGGQRGQQWEKRVVDHRGENHQHQHSLFCSIFVCDATKERLENKSNAGHEGKDDPHGGRVHPQLTANEGAKGNDGAASHPVQQVVQLQPHKRLVHGGHDLDVCPRSNIQSHIRTPAVDQEIYERFIHELREGFCCLSFSSRLGFRKHLGAADRAPRMYSCNRFNGLTAF